MHHIKPFIMMANGKKRLGKGFSPDEIKQAGINRAEARKLGIPVDFKRKTAHEENVNNLKAHKEKNPIIAKPKPPAEEPAENKKKSKS
jgi:large subunit ribosomal protein L13e